MIMDRTKYNKFTVTELKMMFEGARMLSGNREFRQASYQMQGDINEYCGGENDFMAEPDWWNLPQLEDGRLDGRMLARQKKAVGVPNA